MDSQDSIWKKKYLKIFTLTSIIGIVLGAIGGYVYYAQIGCNNGSCAIGSNPYISTLWGAVMGYLLGDMFNKKPKE